MGLPGQVCLLLWKNWILQKRRICVTVFEVLLPVLFACLFVAVRSAVEKQAFKSSTDYEKENVSIQFEYSSAKQALIGYAPKTSDTDQVMTNFLRLLQTSGVHYNNFSIKGFQSENEAVNFYKKNDNVMHFIIVFQDAATALPKKMSITLRPETTVTWNTEFTYPPLQLPGPRDQIPYYKQKGIPYLQNLVGTAVIQYWLSKTGKMPNFKPFAIYTKRMSYPPYIMDPLITVLQALLPLFMVLSLILSVIISTKNLVYEKERKLKEAMKLMGLTSAAQWIAWFLTFALYLVPAMGLYTWLFFYQVVAAGPVLAGTDASLFFVFLLCYTCSVITFCFMVSTFVQKANTGAVLAGILFYAFFVPFDYIKFKYNTTDKKSKIAYCLFFNCAMGMGIRNIATLEGTGEGARWSNFYYPATIDDSISLLEIMIMLLIDSVNHFIVSWYLDNVCPGEFGVPQPYFFCFTKSYWFAQPLAKDDSSKLDKIEGRYFEKEPSGRNAGIQIRNLRKTFGVKVAVAGTSLNMYEGQITALLGHNGAGKTTTMSMLTGFIPPTSGTAIVNGYDIRENIAGVRSSLGLCPQHNILFDTMTVKEHLIFFGKLKGCSGPSLNEEVDKIAKSLGLENKINAPSKVLSGGQKRKLSVGIALIGGSKVVIFDEPTAGMDPAARRQMWNVLQEARAGRTIVLSTHYMDEADLLGDRIAIMAEGVVKCCGTSIFLKKLYGAGYHLVVVKKTDCNVRNLTHAVKKFVPRAELETVISAEVTYLLPDDESSKFPSLFRHLDSNKGQLKINSFGTSVTTMEEVFLKVGECAGDFVAPRKSKSSRKTPELVSLNAGTEYQLVIVKKSQCDVDNLTNIIQAFAPAAEIVTVTNTEVTYNFPPNDVTKVEDIFSHLKSNKEELGIEFEESEITAAQVSHEESIASDSDDVNGDKDFLKKNEAAISAFNKGFTKKTGLSLEIGRMYAIFVKKAIITRRQFLVTLSQLLIPVLFTILATGENETPQGIVNPYLAFDLAPFGETFIPYTTRINASPSETDFGNLYIKQFDNTQTKEHFELKEYKTFDNYTLKRAADLSTPIFNKKVIIGMEVTNAVPPQTIAVIAHFNGQPFHSEPISVSYLMNTLLQFNLDNSYSLQTAINPLPHIAVKSEDQQGASGLAVGLLMSFGMAFMTAFFIYFPIRERQVGAKHMQVISGVKPLTYWLPTFTYDFISFIVPSIAVLAVFAAFKEQAYVGDFRWALVILVLILYGWAVLPFMYAIQFAFSSPPTGVVMVIIFSIISGLVTTLTVSILEFPVLGSMEKARLLDYIFKIVFPSYNLASCFSRINTNYYNQKECEPRLEDCKNGIRGPCCKDTCGEICLSFESNYLSWQKPGIGSYLLFMGLQGILFSLIVLFIDYNLCQKIWYRFIGDVGPEAEATKEVEDSDVADERKRITSTRTSVLINTDSLVLINLYKRYKNYVAVNHICVGIPEQECFGLLGQNGAGKSTTFKMLTGDVMITGGNAYLKGYDVRNNIKQVQANMGYCPQFDALIEQLTGRETLTMFARFRGIPENDIALVVKTLADILTFDVHIDKPCGQYSGGNKRKLSTAVALIGDPPIIMLDEPSAGMDPEARRNLWNVLSQVRASGRTLVLTSHSMEECDALCTRIAIMVNGRFMCLGSPQHLKNKFGQGYTLTVQLKSLEDGSTAPNQPVVDFITSRFPGAKVFDDHEGYIHFQVPDATISLADVFSLMETTKETLHVQDYSVHQATLEQVFLTFTRTQAMATEVKSTYICIPSCLS